MEKASIAVVCFLLWSVIQDCYIWNSICAAELASMSKLLITRNPENITGAWGETATMHRTIQGFPWPNVTWYKNNQPLNGVREHKYDDNRHMLILRNTSLEDEGLYHCEGNNRIEIVTLQAAYLLPAAMDRKFTRQWSCVTVRRGDVGSVECELPFDNPAARVSWFNNNRLLSNQENLHLVSKENGDLAVSSVQESDAEEYFCRALNPHISCTVTSRQISLKVLVPPMTVSFKTDLTVSKGFSAAMTCIATGNGIIVYPWYKSGHLIKNSEGKHRNKGQEMLLIPRVNLADESIYRCAASSTLGRYERTGRLKVHVPPSILFLNASTQVHHGLEFTLFCDVSGIPKPNIFWFFKNRPLIASDWPNFLTENGILTIRKAMQSVEGIYECEAVNEAGSAKRSVAVYIEAPEPDDLSIPASYISAPTSLAPEENFMHSDILTAIVSPSSSMKSKHLHHSHSPSSKVIRSLPVSASSVTSLDSQSSAPEAVVALNIAVTSTVKPFPSATMLTARPSPPSALAAERPFQSSEMTTGKSFPSGKISTVNPFQSCVISAMKLFSSSASVAKRPLSSPVASTMKYFLSPSMSSVRPFQSQAMPIIPTISIMNAFSTLTPLALGSPSLDTSLLIQHSTPVEVALNPARVSSTVSGTTQTSNANSLLEIYLSSNPGRTTIVTQEQLHLLTRNSTLPSLRTYLRYLSKEMAKYSSEPAWSSNCTTSQPFRSSAGTIGIIKRGETKPKESSSYFALEKHDIPIVVGVTISLVMIFITMCIYSVRQKKNESKETEQRLLRNSRMSCQNRDRFEMHTHENRAFEEDSPSHAVEQTTHGRPNVIACSPKQSSVKAITVTAEFALVSQSENLFSISGNNHLQISNKDSSKGEQQKAKIAIPSRSRSSLSHHEDIVQDPNTWKQNTLFQEKLLTSLLMVGLNRNSFTEENRKIELLTRSNSIPCCTKKASWRVEPALFNACSHSDKIQGASYSSLWTIEKQSMKPGMVQLHTEATSSDLSRSFSSAAGTSTGIKSVAADVLKYSQLPAASSLPNPVSSSAAVQLASVPRKQLDGLDYE
ncbi:hemicentin-2-like [Stegostoma tigrinum]|uniref:hemicentin-2-like n=1 Tax=Stegostoma tigrinum TaxID=3053191 RepID=UPI00202B2239|nr:hemicentin-2-like [Stegostoma tigrinum]